MKMHRLLTNLLGIALLLTAAGCIIVQPQPPAPQQGPKEKYVLIEGPIFAVQKSPGIYDTVQIKQVFVQLNPDLEPTRMQALMTNIMQSRVEIKEALQQIVLTVGYQYLFNDEKRAMMEGRLRQEIIRILKGNFSDKDVKGVVLDKYSISS